MTTKASPNRLPLYKKVTDQLREECLAVSGAMLPSLRQLSQKLDVNHATISRALKELEAEGIVEIVPRKGIFSVPRTHSHANIEFVVLVSDRSNLLDVAVCIGAGMESECERISKKGLQFKVTRNVLAVPEFPDAERFVAELKSRGTVGVVLLGFGFLDGEAADREDEFIALIAEKLPVVLAGSPHSSLELDCVYGDPNAQMQEFLEACFDEGLREFEYLADRGDNLLQRQRREGFQEFIARHQLNWGWGDLKTQDTPQLAQHLRSLPALPEVVVATNVRRALTIALEAQSRGLRIPEQLHILCFASLLEHAQPLLPYATVIMLDEPGVGKRAVQLVQQRIDELKGDRSPSQGIAIERVPAHFASGPRQRRSNTLVPTSA